MAPEMDQGQGVSFLEFSREDLEAYIAELGEPAFRARQLWEWIYKRYADDFHEMSNLPLTLRERLEANATVAPIAPIRADCLGERGYAEDSLSTCRWPDH